MKYIIDSEKLNFSTLEEIFDEMSAINELYREAGHNTREWEIRREDINPDCKKRSVLITLELCRLHIEVNDIIQEQCREAYSEFKQIMLDALDANPLDGDE